MPIAFKYLPQYYSLIYLRFAKHKSKLGKGISLTPFNEEPLIEFFKEVFSAYFVKAQRIAHDFLVEHVEKLRYPWQRSTLLNEYEATNENSIISELITLTKHKLTRSISIILDPSVVEYLRSLNADADIIDGTERGTILIRARDEREFSLLKNLSKLGLVLHFTRSEQWYLNEGLKDGKCFAVPSIVLSERFLKSLESEIQEHIARSHRLIQGVLVKLGELLGYEASAEVSLFGYLRPRYDVVWFKDGRPIKVFEVQRGKQLDHAINNLMMAIRHNIKAILVVPSHEHEKEAILLLQKAYGSPRSIIGIITVQAALRLYEAVKDSKDVIQVLT